jgi:excinuclease ABC subunit B
MKLYLADAVAVLVMERKAPLRRLEAERILTEHAALWRTCSELALLLRNARVDADAQRHLEQQGWSIFRSLDVFDRTFSITRIPPLVPEVSFPASKSAAQQTLNRHFAQLPRQRFKLIAPYKPTGDQPDAIEQLTKRLVSTRFQVLKGATGTGKTFVVANLIARHQRPTLVLAHNKTLAAQLYRELRGFFPLNAVEYFVSYYDFYLPEAYNSATDTYIEKSASINKDIDRYRHAATRALFERRDVIIVSSISCIYGLGIPSEYLRAATTIKLGDAYSIDRLTRVLEGMLYERKQDPKEPGTFRTTADVVDISLPSWDERQMLLRIRIHDHIVRELVYLDRRTEAVVQTRSQLTLYPARHFLMPPEEKERALHAITAELAKQISRMRAQGQFLEAERLQRRTNQDLELLRQHGYCAGIENYAMHLAGRAPGAPPECLLDYFPPDWLLVVDESHVTVPQVRGMYHGDRARKENLVRYGFRLPSALENRPLQEHEFWSKISRCVFVSATPGPFELSLARDAVVELLIRPTHVLDPLIHIQPTHGQVEHLTLTIRERSRRGEKVIVTTLSKRMAEELCLYLREQRIRVSYLHSELNAMDRVEVLSALATDGCDVIVGVNLLREGIDLPQVSLVAILDADKEGFLRSETALIQTMGRAARHVAGTVTLYADTITDSMQRAILETERRRMLQAAYNARHGLKPRPIVSKQEPYLTREGKSSKANSSGRVPPTIAALDDQQLRACMHGAADQLDFELAAAIRDLLQKRQLERLESSLSAQRLDEECVAPLTHQERDGL